MRSHNKTMQSRCQNELGISAELRYVGFQKLLVIMRNRCQEGKNTRVPRDREADVAKEVQAECEAYVKILRSQYQCDVGSSAELRYVGCQKLLELMRSRCREWK